MSDSARSYGSLSRLHPRPDQGGAVEAHMAAWHRRVGRTLPGTQLHLLLGVPGGPDEIIALHLFESVSAYRRAAGSPTHHQWLAELTELLRGPPAVTEVAVRWNASTGARPRVSVSIDRDVHASVQDLIGRLIDRHPRTPAEELYLNMLQSIAADYEREFPGVMPEEEEPR